MNRSQCEAAARQFDGCDFVLALPADRKNIRLLQLTDMQLIDAAHRCTPDRLRLDETAAWDPAYFDAQCGDYIRSLVTQTRPDLIFITGDVIYGSFDDAGTTFTWFCRFMDSLGIPWAAVFGNHDNESKMGTAWQCDYHIPGQLGVTLIEVSDGWTVRHVPALVLYAPFLGGSPIFRNFFAEE